ncbi:hypothetical protein D3C71_1715700 [compost metagenome]
MAANLLGVFLHARSMALTHAQVVDQRLAFDGVPLVEDVFVDGTGGADAAFLGDLLQHGAQLVLLLGSRLGRQRQGEQQAQGRDDKTQHGTLLVR